MNVEGHNLETLRNMVRNLQNENEKLKALLKQHHIPFFESTPKEDNEMYENQASLINSYYFDSNDVAAFLTRFMGRKNVYAHRGKNGGYFPQCNNRWNDVCPKNNDTKQKCDDCLYQDYKPLTREIGMKHLIGAEEWHVIGIYPLLENGCCYLLVFDFDNHKDDNISWQEEVLALRKICDINNVPYLVERSRSGNGSHFWIFFKEEVPASLAREFGKLLLEKGSQSVNLRSFRYYDRMFPAQDYTKGLGNLIALPLQGYAIRKGNSCFVDENFNAYPNQWTCVKKTGRLTLKEVEEYVGKWKIELCESEGRLFDNTYKVVNPWKKDIHFHQEDIVGTMSITLVDGLYIDAINLKPRMQYQIRSLATFDNPEYYSKQRQGFSNWNQSSFVSLAREINDYIKLPRGVLEKLLELCQRDGIKYIIKNKRFVGNPIHVEFLRELQERQSLASARLEKYDDGVFNAATGFGKTAVGIYMIAIHKVNTLILVNNLTLQNQWVDELTKFLHIDEPLATYTTPKGTIKTTETPIGVLNGNTNSLSGTIDVASISSLANKENITDIIGKYGMIIVDECHHAASTTYRKVLENANVKYVYGFSANAKRTDKLEKIIYMLLGPQRFEFTAKENTLSQNMDHHVCPRFTRVINTSPEKIDSQYEAESLIYNHKNRNQMIIDDVIESVNNKRTPIILTGSKKHAEFLYGKLKQSIENTYLIYGEQTQKENIAIKEAIKVVPNNKTCCLVATAQSIGEGFDFPRADTLFLVLPVSSPYRLEQYVGRVNRNYKGKTAITVYDYVDMYVSYLSKMYKKRLKTYKKIGYDIITSANIDKQQANFIYGYQDYIPIFERDIHDANKDIIIASPQLENDKVNRLIELVMPLQLRGILVTVLTQVDCHGHYEYLLCQLKEAGIIVREYEELENRFAVIDQSLVWYGSVQLLGKEDIDDHMMRIDSHDIASELLEMTCQSQPEESKLKEENE